MEETEQITTEKLEEKIREYVADAYTAVGCDCVNESGESELYESYSKFTNVERYCVYCDICDRDVNIYVTTDITIDTNKQYQEWVKIEAFGREEYYEVVD